MEIPQKYLDEMGKVIKEMDSCPKCKHHPVLEPCQEHNKRLMNIHNRMIEEIRK